MYYINRESGRYKETVDQFTSKRDAIKYCEEYQRGEHGRAYYYVSQTPLNK